MAYEAILNSEIEVDDAITQSLMQKIKDNFDFFNSSVGGGPDLINNSFDIDSDSDGVPDSWDVSLYAGGSQTLDSTNAAHGAKALKFVHPGGPGNGGGFVTSDYIPCNENYPFIVEFLNKCSQSGVKVAIHIRYYTEVKVFISNEIIYSDTTNPTSWEVLFTSSATVPTTAQYLKVRVIGGIDDTDPGSSTDIYFDNILIKYDPFDIYTSNGSTLGQFIVSESGGDNASTNIASSGTVGATPTKIAEAEIMYPGEVDIRMHLAPDGTTGKARVYVNGSPVGTEHSFTTSTSKQDLSIAVEKGDLLQIYGYGAVSDGMFLHRLTVYSDDRAHVLPGFFFLFL